MQQGFFVGDAGAVGGKALIGSPMGMAHHLCEFGKQAVVAAANQQGPIHGVEGFIGNKATVARGMAHGLAAFVDQGLRLLRIPSQGGFKQRRMQHAAPPRLVALLQHGQGANHHPHAGALVHHRGPQAHGRVVRPAVGAGQAAESLQQGFIAGAQFHGAGVTKGRNFTVDQSGVSLAQAGPIDAHVFGDAGPQVVDQDVGAGHQLLKSRQTGFTLQIQGQGFFAPVEQMKVQGVPAAKHRAHAPTVIAAIHTLNFEHFCAQVGEDGACKGAGQNLPEFNHPQTIQRARVGGG